MLNEAEKSLLKDIVERSRSDVSDDDCDALKRLPDEAADELLRYLSSHSAAVVNCLSNLNWHNDDRRLMVFNYGIKNSEDACFRALWSMSFQKTWNNARIKDLKHVQVMISLKHGRKFLLSVMKECDAAELRGIIMGWEELSLWKEAAELVCRKVQAWATLGVAKSIITNLERNWRAYFLVYCDPTRAAELAKLMNLQKTEAAEIYRVCQLRTDLLRTGTLDINKKPPEITDALVRQEFERSFPSDFCVQMDNVVSKRSVLWLRFVVEFRFKVLFCQDDIWKWLDEVLRGADTLWDVIQDLVELLGRALTWPTKHIDTFKQLFSVVAANPGQNWDWMVTMVDRGQEFGGDVVQTVCEFIIRNHLMVQHAAWMKVHWEEIVKFICTFSVSSKSSFASLINSSWNLLDEVEKWAWGAVCTEEKFSALKTAGIRFSLVGHSDFANWQGFLEEIRRRQSLVVKKENDARVAWSEFANTQSWYALLNDIVLMMSGSRIFCCDLCLNVFDESDLSKACPRITEGEFQGLSLGDFVFYRRAAVKDSLQYCVRVDQTTTSWQRFEHSINSLMNGDELEVTRFVFPGHLDVAVCRFLLRNIALASRCTFLDARMWNESTWNALKNELDDFFDGVSFEKVIFTDDAAKKAIASSPVDVKEWVQVAATRQEAVVTLEAQMQTRTSTSSTSTMSKPSSRRQTHLQGSSVRQYNRQWDFTNVEKLGTGKGTTIAILDGAFELWHPTLRGRVDCVRSFVDDCNVWPGVKTTEATHGTGVAVILCEAAKGARLVLGRVHEPGPKSTRNLAKAIDWAVAKRCDVISCSIGVEAFDEELFRAVNRALERNIYIVCAVSNQGQASRQNAMYPAKFGHCICVGACDRVGNASFDSAVCREVEFLAPGEDLDIHRAFPVGAQKSTINGTSAAVPCVAALLCILTEWFRKRFGTKLSVHEMKDLLREMCTHPGAHSAKEGFGMLMLDRRFASGEFLETTIRDILLITETELLLRSSRSFKVPQYAYQLVLEKGAIDRHQEWVTAKKAPMGLEPGLGDRINEFIGNHNNTITEVGVKGSSVSGFSWKWKKERRSRLWQPSSDYDLYVVSRSIYEGIQNGQPHDDTGVVKVKHRSEGGKFEFTHDLLEELACLLFPTDLNSKRRKKLDSIFVYEDLSVLSRDSELVGGSPLWRCDGENVTLDVSYAVGDTSLWTKKYLEEHLSESNASKEEIEEQVKGLNEETVQQRAPKFLTKTKGLCKQVVCAPKVSQALIPIVAILDLLLRHSIFLPNHASPLSGFLNASPVTIGHYQDAVKAIVDRVPFVIAASHQNVPWVYGQIFKMAFPEAQIPITFAAPGADIKNTLDDCRGQCTIVAFDLRVLEGAVYLADESGGFERVGFIRKNYGVAVGRKNDMCVYRDGGKTKYNGNSVRVEARNCHIVVYETRDTVEGARHHGNDGDSGGSGHGFVKVDDDGGRAL